MKIEEMQPICMTVEKQRRKTCFPLSIFALFFHPSTHVTAMGGAEKRFVETLKVFCQQSNVKIAVLESSPSLLGTSKIACKKYSLSSGFHGKGWLSTYIEWGFWIVKALFKSTIVLRLENPNVILVTNNTLPNLTVGYITGLIFHRSMCTVVHHIDIPSKIGAKDNSLYCGYRNINYTKSVSLIKTLAFHITLFLLEKANAIIAVSNFTARALRNNGIHKNKIVVSGNAVDFNFIESIKPHKDEKIFDGVFVGRISKEKGIFDLIDVWKKVAEKKKNAKLLIIGTGLELDSLKAKIAENGLKGNVLIHGQCTDIELYSLLKSGKVFIFPSRFEGWGIAVAEALACGAPVVAYNIPALREVFGQSKSVFLVPVTNLRAMAQTVLELLSNEYEKFGEISAEYARKFEWDKVAMTDLEAITGIVAENLQ
jgi:glycosyltransferase involved in cell wall biosynthesis